MYPAESSLIASYGYDPEAQTLRIAFHQGGTWDYAGVTMDVFLGFVQANSKGKYFLASIKGRHKDKRA
jgi:hypothetical protein